jgi:hypothetical protein
VIIPLLLFCRAYLYLLWPNEHRRVAGIKFLDTPLKGIYYYRFPYPPLSPYTKLYCTRVVAGRLLLLFILYARVTTDYLSKELLGRIASNAEAEPSSAVCLTPYSNYIFDTTVSRKYYIIIFCTRHRVSSLYFRSLQSPWYQYDIIVLLRLRLFC